MSSILNVYNKQQFNADVSFNSNASFNNTSTQISSSEVGISGGVINMSSYTFPVLYASGDTKLSSRNGYTTFINNDKTSGHLYINANSTSSNMIVENGNVGIGKTNPAYKLDVSGTANFSGATTLGGTLALSSGNGIFLNGNGSVNCGSGAVNCGTLGCTSINTNNGTVTVGLGAVNCGAINCSSTLTTSNLGSATTGSILYINDSTGRVTKGALPASSGLQSGSNISVGTISCGPITSTGAISGTYFYTSFLNITGTVGQYMDQVTPATIKAVGLFTAYGARFGGDGVWSNTFNTYSDTRIKSNIVDIDDSKALSILREIQPKTYEYVDKLQRGNNTVIGFIAQEIQEILPNAVTITRDYIPNFYTNCQITATDVSNIVLVTSPIDLSWCPLHDASGNAFIDEEGNACSDASGNKIFNLKFYNQKNGYMCFSTTTSILDKRSFLMDIEDVKTLSGSTKLKADELQDGYLLYGQEVDDFHNIDKSAIFTVVTAAVQDIDRIVQAQQAQIQSDSAKISALEQQVASLQTQNAAFEARLAAKGF